MPQAHHEINLEAYVTKKLVANGWLEGNPEKYDRHLALYPEDVVEWVKASQPEKWDKLYSINGEETTNVLLNRLDKELKSKNGGTINVIRHGFSIAGAGRIDMSQCAPEDKNNEILIEKYKANRLRVVRQVKYNPTREWSIDIVLFVNGVPTATLELKTDFTQSIEDAITQYKEDRIPEYKMGAKKVPEPLLSFKRGAVVHFAMSDSEIAMTTELKGDSTFFLPFNKGNSGHAGNAPREDGEYPVAYFWEEVCTRDSWLRIFHSFVYVETKEKVDKHGKPYKAETLIFPRYHQFEAVNKMIQDVKKNGPGYQYLNEHSAGSGKTSTIAWTAHDLIKIRHDDGTPYFNSVVIVTDRTVLDAQLQDAVQQLDHQFGVIEAIDSQQFGDSKSKRLAQALKEGVPIIVVTIQTFPFAMEAILTDKTLKDRNFAVIIDEAHTSQTGSTAQGLRAALSMDSKKKMDKMDIEEVLLEIQKSRVRPSNVSHFAFTATPKHSTLTLFGRCPDPSQPPSDINKPESFHKYTQRQAIEEGFILDVLQNYIPYREAYRLGVQGVEDKRVDKKLANRALARWKSLHPTNVTQKVEFIVNHFMNSVVNLLDGEAKAMVVTSGRAQAVKYKMAFDKYIQKHNLQGIKALVAFSGKVPGHDLGEDDPKEPLGFDPESEYTEYNLNPDADGKDLRNAFEETQFNVMIVANKFQTGFNQPKLVAMYLDKKISGVEAVQTLSRLNRTYPGKEDTYVIDFVNDPETILDAFKSYDDGAEMAEVQDLNVVYEIKSELDNAGIYNQSDLDHFKTARGKFLIGKDLPENVHKRLYAATQRPTDIYNAKFKELSDAIKEWDKAFDKAYKASDEKGMSYAEAKRSELSKEREEYKRFKTVLSRFVRVYNYIAQLVELSDAELENFAAFSKLLSRRLDGVTPENVDLSGIVLTHYAIKKRDGDAEGEAEPVRPITGGGGEPIDREKEFLTQIISRMNDIFGDVSDQDTQQNFVEGSYASLFKDPKVAEQVDKNTKEQALQGDLMQVLISKIFNLRNDYKDLSDVVFKDQDALAAFASLLIDKRKHDLESQK